MGFVPCMCRQRCSRFFVDVGVRMNGEYVTVTGAQSVRHGRM